MDGSYPFVDHLKANVERKMKTWAIKWHTSVFLKRGLCLHPIISLTRNIGFDGSGENCNEHELYGKQRISNKIEVAKIDLKENLFFRQKIVKFNLSQVFIANQSFLKRLINKTKQKIQQ